MTARLPPALENGEPMIRRIRDEFHIGTRSPGKGDVVRLNYPAVSTDPRKARLTVRERESDTRTEIPADAWEFVDNRSIRLLPLGANFAPVKIYEIWYEATGSTVMGVGFAATRDLVAFLRYERADHHGTPNPMIGGGSGVAHALAFGVSQAGRFLRHFLELGMNDDGHGRRVFDGVLTHVAGAGKVFANHSFAMPGRTATQHEDRLYPENWFPFGNAATTDPFSGKTRRNPERAADGPSDNRGEHLDRILAKGRLLGAYRSIRPARRRTAVDGAGLHDRRDTAWRRPGDRSEPWPLRQPAQPA